METIKFKEGQPISNEKPGIRSEGDSSVTCGTLLIIDSAAERFCCKCGNYYKEASLVMCPHCNISLSYTESYKVERKCSKCGYTIQAPPSYFMEHNDMTCPSCKEGHLETKEIYGEAPSFSINGKFNGANRGKMIREKNEQLKKKNAGYSYETPESIRDKTQRQFKERKK